MARRLTFLCLSLVVLLLCGLLVFSPAAAQDATPQPAMGRVEGVVKNLTAGGEPLAGIPVVLRLLQDFQPVQTFTSTVASGGHFAFHDVPLVEGRSYIATLEYQNVTYGSSLVSYDGSGEVIELHVDAYEATSDPGSIAIGRLHVVVDFFPGAMRVSELYILDNHTDQVFAGATGNPDDGTLELPLPAGAVNSNVERGMGETMVPATNSVIRTEGGYQDTLPVRPGRGSQQLIVEFEIPYDGEALVSHPLPYPAESVSLFLPDVGLVVESDLLAEEGMLEMGGQRLLQWDATGVPAGATLSFRVSGKVDLRRPEEMPGEKPQSPLLAAAGDNPTTWAIGIGGVLLSAGLVLLMERRQSTAAAPSQREELLHAIVELDSARDAGDVPAGRHELEREQLMTALRAWYRQSEATGDRS